jgi:purine-binding chemotaxis protein CheW
VLDLAGVLGGSGPVNGRRFLVVDLGERSVALLVEAVSGVEDLPADGLEGVPPLLQEAAGRAIRAMGSLDRELLLVLEAARLVPEEVWQHLRGEIRAST